MQFLKHQYQVNIFLLGVLVLWRKRCERVFFLKISQNYWFSSIFQSLLLNHMSHKSIIRACYVSIFFRKYFNTGSRLYKKFTVQVISWKPPKSAIFCSFFLWFFMFAETNFVGHFQIRVQNLWKHKTRHWNQLHQNFPL